MPNLNGGLYSLICTVPGGAFAATYVSDMCNKCMLFFSCNATASYATANNNNVGMDETTMREYCRTGEIEGYSVIDFLETYPLVAAYVADLGWNAGESYFIDEQDGNGAMALQEIAMIGYRECLDGGVCEPCPAKTYCQPVGECSKGYSLLFSVSAGDCPNGGLSEINNNYSIQSCYINGTFSDNTGRGEYADKCYYVLD